MLPIGIGLHYNDLSNKLCATVICLHGYLLDTVSCLHGDLLARLLLAKLPELALGSSPHTEKVLDVSTCVHERVQRVFDKQLIG